MVNDMATGDLVKWTATALWTSSYTDACFFFRCRAREALRQCLPDHLKDSTFAACLKEDNSTKRWLAQLLKNLESTAGPAAPGGIPLPPQWQ